MSDDLSLGDLGWSRFQQAIVDGQREDTGYGGRPARVVSLQRSVLRVLAPGIDATVPVPRDIPGGTLTVGDWVLLDAAAARVTAVLERCSLFKRRAPGSDRREQLIAANVDTLLVVSSCNLDFSEARLERYLAIGREAGVMTVIVLTKADLCDDPADYVRRAARLAPGQLVECVDARDRESLRCLDAWLAPGQTLAMLGSSGVGKSTLGNTLIGRAVLATAAIREDDDKGRHTTTTRQMQPLPGGAWLIDTPGMRELQLTDVESGLDDVFAEISALAAHCRFGDCLHDAEPGCAVRRAVEDGAIDAARVRRWRKLMREESHNRESLAERRARDKSTGRLYKRVIGEKQSRTGRKS